MNIRARRIRLEPQTNRGDESIIFFEDGNISKPLFVLNNFATVEFILEILRQLTHDELIEVKDEIIEIRNNLHNAELMEE